MPNAGESFFGFSDERMKRWRPRLYQNGFVETNRDQTWAYYARSGDLMVVTFSVVSAAAGSSGSIVFLTDLPAFTLPDPLAQTTNGPMGVCVGQANFLRPGVQTSAASVMTAPDNTPGAANTPFPKNQLCFIQAATGYFGNNPSFALASGHQVSGFAIYKAWD